MRCPPIHPSCALSCPWVPRHLALQPQFWLASAPQTFLRTLSRDLTLTQRFSSVYINAVPVIVWFQEKRKWWERFERPARPGLWGRVTLTTKSQAGSKSRWIRLEGDEINSRLVGDDFVQSPIGWWGTVIGEVGERSGRAKKASVQKAQRFPRRVETLDSRLRYEAR